MRRKRRKPLPSPAETPPEGDKHDRLRKKASSTATGYAKYSGVAIQMIVILLVFVYGGKWLDANVGDGGTLYTTICALVGIGLALYIPLRGL